MKTSVANFIQWLFAGNLNNTIRVYAMLSNGLTSVQKLEDIRSMTRSKWGVMLNKFLSDTDPDWVRFDELRILFYGSFTEEETLYTFTAGQSVYYIDMEKSLDMMGNDRTRYIITHHETYKSSHLSLGEALETVLNIIREKHGNRTDYILTPERREE
jgi:hypothetical protein